MYIVFPSTKYLERPTPTPYVELISFEGTTPFFFFFISLVLRLLRLYYNVYIYKFLPIICVTSRVEIARRALLLDAFREDWGDGWTPVLSSELLGCLEGVEGSTPEYIMSWAKMGEAVVGSSDSSRKACCTRWIAGVV